ncbi:interleukin-1 receptor-like 1 [Colossoma macropomum]|uniref:interleukin-1 receptor-like 1 n=1 Tax=Colossoma macropomum TaxID=42526 RepID=UPI001863F5A0|nr:interleukin-1 receptor-like 1 [Colossoma macropomum]
MTELCIIFFFLTKLVMTSTYKDSTVQCYKHPERDNISVIQGEALHCPCANNDCSQETNHTMISWFKNGSDGIQKITTDESARVHHHGPDLYILPLTVNDTGLYITRWWETEENCNEFETYIEVSEEFHTDQLYSNSSEEPANVWISCPVCENQDKTLIWYKDLHLIPGRSEEHLRISNFSKKDEGIYTCLCTWEHNGIKYNTSGSRQLHITEPSTNFPTTILYPNNMSVEFVDLGSKVELNCSAFFGFNVRDQCSVLWLRNNTQLDGAEGYTVYERKETETFHSFLTIHKVSEMDLQSEFHCKAISPYKWMYVIITLKSRESVLPLVVMFLCIFLIILLAAGTTKWYAMDLALFFRGLGLVQNKRNDGKIYDAYVIYQKDNVDEKMKKKLAHFINSVLPAILENHCGFKLYIHGRDDLPGEDCIELTEMRMQLSRRLIVVLTPGFSQEQDLMTPAQGYDWQVGLHRVLVQQETSMILIQLGEIKDYSHLPLGLQHLLQKSPPLKWNEGSRQAASPSSHFWKQVRYMMPVIPAQQCGPNLGSL